MTRSFKWTKLRTKILERDNYRCTKCNHKYLGYYINKEGIRINESDLIVDHIIPIKMNGKDFDPLNLQTLCIDCNKIKNATDQSNIAKLKRQIKQGLKDD